MNKFIVNVEVVIIHKDKWLLVRRSSSESHAAGLLSLVGGKVDVDDSKNNTLEYAALREINEEIGVKLDRKLIYVHSSQFVSERGNNVLDVVFSLVLSERPKIKPSEEIAQYLWLNYGEITKKEDLPQWVKNSIEKAYIKKSAGPGILPTI